MLDIFAATRFGDTSRRRSFIHIPASRRERSNLGMRTGNVGVYWRSSFPESTQRTHARNILSSARTACLEGTCTRLMY